MFTRWAYAGVLAVVCAACSANVQPEDGGSSAGGNGAGGGGAGGGPPPEPRMLEVAIGQVEDTRRLLVNDRAGALKESRPLQGSPFQVEVVDGDLVSVLDGSSLQSYRVTPELTRLGPYAEAEGCPDVEPMTVTVVFPVVDNAVEYTAISDGNAQVNRFEAGSSVMDVRACDGSFDIVAYAKDDSRIIRHELLRDLPFAPGGQMTLELVLASDDRQTQSVLVHGEGLEVLFGHVEWSRHPNLFFGYEPLLMEVAGPRYVFEASPIFVGEGFGQINTGFYSRFAREEEWCDAQSLARTRDAADTFSYSPGRLAAPRPAGTKSWRFANDGERGDIVSHIWVLGSGATWQVHEDPQRAPVEAVFPELPSDVSWDEGEPSFLSIAHGDIEERAGYAALLEQPPSYMPPYTRATRSWSKSCSD